MSYSEFKNKIIISTLLASIAGMLCGAVAGFCLGFNEGIKYEKKHAKNCFGYTVLDANHVVSCKGDTLLYHWKFRYSPFKENKHVQEIGK